MGRGGAHQLHRFTKMRRQKSKDAIVSVVTAQLLTYECTPSLLNFGSFLIETTIYSLFYILICNLDLSKVVLVFVQVHS
jgi:hypothetical protein